MNPLERTTVSLEKNQRPFFDGNLPRFGQESPLVLRVLPRGGWTIYEGVCRRCASVRGFDPRGGTAAQQKMWCWHSGAPNGPHGATYWRGFAHQTAVRKKRGVNRGDCAAQKIEGSQCCAKRYGEGSYEREIGVGWKGWERKEGQRNSACEKFEDACRNATVLRACCLALQHKFADHIPEYAQAPLVTLDMNAFVMAVKQVHKLHVVFRWKVHGRKSIAARP